MSGRRRGLSVALGLVLCLACGRREHPGGPGDAKLGGDLARVGSRGISPATVEALSKARGLSPRAALALAVEDALLAEHFARTHSGAVVEPLGRVARAWAVIDALSAEARALGPATGEEIEAICPSL